jgi:hypothetical protein
LADEQVRPTNDRVRVFGDVGHTVDHIASQYQISQGPCWGLSGGHGDDPTEAFIAELAHGSGQGSVIDKRSGSGQHNVEADYGRSASLDTPQHSGQVAPWKRLALTHGFEGGVVDRDYDDVGHVVRAPEVHEKIETPDLRLIQIAEGRCAGHADAGHNADRPQLEQTTTLRSPPRAWTT